jgi:hypothetical protein
MVDIDYWLHQLCNTHEGKARLYGNVQGADKVIASNNY